MYRKTQMYSLRRKEILNFALFSIPKGGKNESSIHPASKVHMIRNDGLTQYVEQTVNISDWHNKRAVI